MARNKQSLTPEQAEKRRKKMESTATFGLLLIAVAMLGPFMSAASLSQGGFNWMQVYKWIYAAGALIYTFARLVNVTDPRDSLRLRRLRRLEFWAGMAFCIGGFFWFYNEQKFGNNPFIGPLTILKDVVAFVMAGAVIQVIASWMIYHRMNKEHKEREEAKKASRNSANSSDQEKSSK